MRQRGIENLRRNLRFYKVFGEDLPTLGRAEELAEQLRGGVAQPAAEHRGPNPGPRLPAGSHPGKCKINRKDRQLSGRMTTDQRIKRAVANAGRQARSAGQTEAQVQAAMAEARELHSDPRYQAHLNRMEEREAREKEAERLTSVRHQNWRDAKFAEALDAHYRDRLGFYQRRGVSTAAFDSEVWPELKRQFVRGEEDAVDRERQERSGSVF